MITCNTVVDHNKRIPRSRLRWIAITKFAHSVYMTCQVPSQDIFFHDTSTVQQSNVQIHNSKSGGITPYIPPRPS